MADYPKLACNLSNTLMCQCNGKILNKNNCLYVENVIPFLELAQCQYDNPDSKGTGVNMRPIWGRQVPGGPYVGPMNLAIWDVL